MDPVLHRPPLVGEPLDPLIKSAADRGVVHRTTSIRYRRKAQILEARFAGVLETVPDAIVLVDEVGRIALVNLEAERLFGYGRLELLGVPFAQVIPSLDDHADARSDAKGAGVEQTALRKDGTALRVQVNVGSVTTGPETLLVASIHDASGQKAGDAQLRALVESGPDALVVVDRTGCIVLVNSLLERLFGYAPAELLGRSLADLLPARFRGTHQDELTRYLEDPRPPPLGIGLELMAERKDGSEFSVEIRLGSVATKEGTLVTAAIRDVSEWVHREERHREASARELRKESAARVATVEMNERLAVAIVREQALAEAARQASEAKSRFLATMSHELRIPLTAITGYSGLIDEGIAGPVTAKQRDYLDKIQAASRHLVGLIEDVLDLAKIEAGQLRLDVTRASASDALVESLVLLQPLAAAADVTVDVFPSSIHYLGDPARIRQVLVNLLSNAVKFTDPGGRVTVTCGETDDPAADAVLSGVGPWAFFAVQDTGIGIAPADAAALFQPFMRAHSAKKREGTGLGLAISRELARRMRGDLTLTSVVGEGSCFTLWLPADTAIDRA